MPRINIHNLIRGHYAAFICYKKSVLKTYKFNNKFNYVMDYEQALRMMSNNIHFGYINRILLAYRRHDETKSKVGFDNFIKERKSLQKEYGQNYLSFNNLLFLDYPLLYLLKLRGISEIFSLLNHNYPFKISFPIKYSSFAKMIFQQALPFIYL